MEKKVSQVMTRSPAVASPAWRLTELERALVANECSGFPVVRQGELVGVVSRTDIVRRTAIESAREGEVSDFFREFGSPERNERSILRAEARAVAEHLVDCTVEDLMSPPTFVVDADASIPAVAAVLVENHIHRVPVTENGKLVGIVTSLDLVALLADTGA